MFDINWNILIAILIIVIIIAYFSNCYEGFAGNSEAIAAISSIYNKDNMSLTNLNVTGKLTSNGDITTNGDIYGARTLNATLGTNAGAFLKVNGDIVAERNILAKGDITTNGKLCIGDTCIDSSQLSNLIKNTIKVDDPVAINSMMDGGDSGAYITKIRGGTFINDATGVGTPRQGQSDSGHGKKFKLIRYPY